MKDLTPIIENYQCNTIKEDYNKFCNTVRYIIKKYKISSSGRRFMVMPYFNGLPFRVTIKHVDDNLKTIFYVSIFINGVEIDATDIISHYGIADNFINELIGDIKKYMGI